MADPSVADLLDQAADLIESDGWWGHGAEPDADGNLVGHCSLTALTMIGRFPQVKVALALLQRRVGGDPLAWNDDPERTADEVIETFRKVAAEARWDES